MEDDEDYKEKWLDILDINSLKRAPRAPKKAIEAMADASSDPDFVKKVMNEWRDGTIDDVEACSQMKKKFGESYKKIEKAGMSAVK